jgi:mevalonate kinase
MKNSTPRPKNEDALGRGKVILLGEHAVVYGVPAIAVGIDRGAHARATPIAAGPSRLVGEGWSHLLDGDRQRIEVTDAADDDRDLGKALRALLDITRERQTKSGSSPCGAFSIEADIDLPPGAGLGCSAAIGVAIARSIDVHASDDEIADRVMAWERVFHGNPSGVDAAVSARGGCVIFEKGRPIETIHAGEPLTLCVGHSGASSSTKSMVESVARMHQRRPQIVEKAFEGIRVLVSNARLAIEAGDAFAIGRLLDLNQMLLSGLFVSTPEIERLCAAARKAGAFGAKLTGAGGGGCVVAIVEGAKGAERVIEAWKSDGFEGFITRVEARHRFAFVRETSA